MNLGWRLSIAATILCAMLPYSLVAADSSADPEPGKAGLLISRGSRTWLVRVSLGRDPEIDAFAQAFNCSLARKTREGQNTPMYSDCQNTRAVPLIGPLLFNTVAPGSRSDGKQSW